MGKFGKLIAPIQLFFSGLFDLLLPGVCPGCSDAVAETTGLCQACNVKMLSLVTLPFCPRCGSTIGPNIPVYEDGCPQCPQPLPRFGCVYRLGPYTQPLRHAICQLKYFGQTRPSAQLAEMLAQAVQASSARQAINGYDVIVPVPMHWSRRLFRGMDHATLLADFLGRSLSLPVSQELVRTRNTPQQVHLSKTKRIANVSGAFATGGSTSLSGAGVLLVDDVTTTCATANECARVLLKAGALRVDLAVLAKAEKPIAYSEHWQE